MFHFLITMMRISRSSALESEGSRCRIDNMLNYTGENATSAVAQADNKSSLHRELLSVFYVVGIIGSLLALLHLRAKRKFKNTKQAFMLK